MFVATLMIVPLASCATSTAQLASVPCDGALPSGARCYTLTVPEDRRRPEGKSISLAAAVLPAVEPRSGADPVVVLLGGPGAAASRDFARHARAHGPANAVRDVIFVDQRGTGRSSPIECAHGSDDDLQTYMDAFVPLDAGLRCGAALEGTTDVTRYRTVDFVADLEDLRQALGVERWHLSGSSYGTRVALQYMARHPGSIRSAVLLGVVPPELVVPAPFPADADRAIAMLLRDCHADPACSRAFPDLASEFDSVAHRLERAPATVHVSHPATGARVPVSFTRAAFGEAVRAALYSPRAARLLPLAVHEAWQGDYTALAAAHLERQRTIAREGWAGLYLAATCPEDIARVDTASTFAQSRNTMLGPWRALMHVAACNGWPAPPSSDTWPAETRLETPVLMIVGDQDPATPPRWARTALERMDNARLVVVPFGGHGFDGLIGSECIVRLQLAFQDTPDPHALDATCVERIRRPPFAVER